MVRRPAEPTGAQERRIAAMCDAIGTREQAAAVARLSSRQLRKILQGQAKPSAETLALLADASGYSLDWVMTGRGAPKRAASAEGTDPELLGRLLEGLAQVYREEGVALPPVELGRLVALAHDQIAHATSDPAARLTMVGLILTQHRERIRGESLRSRQHGA